KREELRPAYKHLQGAEHARSAARQKRLVVLTRGPETHSTIKAARSCQRLKMGLYEPASPVYSGPSASEEGSTKRLANKKRRRNIVENPQLQDTVASDRLHVKALKVDETRARGELEGQPKTQEALPQDDGGGGESPHSTALDVTRNDSAKEELRSPEVRPHVSARTADPMDEVESGAAGGAQLSAGPATTVVDAASAEQGVRSPVASTRTENCVDKVESGGASDAESSADAPCDAGPMPIGVRIPRSPL
ncbi:hypothetical protein KFL_011440020, partial [Klebsormidium nitens]